VQVQRHGAAIGALQGRRQRIEEARKHERQRFERVDRPLQLDGTQETRNRGIRYQRPRIEAARQTLNHQSVGAKPSGQIGRGKRSELAKSGQSPAPQHLTRSLVGSRGCRTAGTRVHACHGVGIPIGQELLKNGNRHAGKRGSRVTGGDGDARPRTCQQHRRRVRRGDSHAGRACLRQLFRNRGGISEQPLEPCHVEDDTPSLPFDARGKIAGDPYQPLGD
jgi:hypothetical protein